MKRALYLLIATLLMPVRPSTAATRRGDWPEPRQNPHLTAAQPLAGAMRDAPRQVAEYDLGRVRPPVSVVTHKGQSVGLTLVAGELRCYDLAGKKLWSTHPPGLNFTSLTLCDDFDGDGKFELLLRAGRPAEPFGAAVLVSLDDGRLLWRYDVEPMSYVWTLHAGSYLPNVPGKQILVLMQGYPPDKANGYAAFFAFEKDSPDPALKWRYDFDQYTCYPTFLQNDLDGDGVKEMIFETHSRLWALDAVTGLKKQFVQWDVAPANIRSYGLTQFADLDGDGRDDFLCIANFAQHHEVLLNRGGQLTPAWHHGWNESVTTGKVATTYPLPAFADLDGDGKPEVVVSMFNAADKPEWVVRAYDSNTGKLKYRHAGLVAASLTDLEGDGVAEVIADATDESDAARPDGSAAPAHPKGASVLRVKGGVFEVAWHDDAARAIRSSSDDRAHVRIGDASFRLGPGMDGQLVSKKWGPPSPPAAPDFSAVPAFDGGELPVLLAADLVGDATNELVVFRAGKAVALEHQSSGFKPFAEYASTCPPGIADLDGDGRLELVLADVAVGRAPVVSAVTPSLGGKTLWRIELPPATHGGNPGPRAAYLRTGRFTGKPGSDVFLWAGVPVVRSVLVDGLSGKLVWEQGKLEGLERHFGPSQNQASAVDYDGDGADDLVFTAPDVFCVAAGPSGKLLAGPTSPQNIFQQPSQGLYTLPAILDGEQSRLIALVAGHDFQAVMTADLKPLWHRLPEAGARRCAAEGFLRSSDGAWLMGYGCQDGSFACVNVGDSKTRWTFDLQASATDAVSGDVDGDGRAEFVFGTSHGELLAVGDDGDKPRVVWRTPLSAGVSRLILADINGDGVSECVVSTVDGRVRVLGQ